MHVHFYCVCGVMCECVYVCVCVEREVSVPSVANLTKTNENWKEHKLQQFTPPITQKKSKSCLWWKLQLQEQKTFSDVLKPDWSNSSRLGGYCIYFFAVDKIIHSTVEEEITRRNEMSIPKSRDSLGVLHNCLSCVLNLSQSAGRALLDYKNADSFHDMRPGSHASVGSI